MNFLKMGLAAAAVMLIGTAAQAGTIVHDDASEFSDIDVVTGFLSNGDPITALNSPGRTDFNAVFDGDVNTFYSVGFGGSISLTVDPDNYDITDGSIIEVTFPSDHIEALQVYLGTDADPFANLIGYLLNANANAHIGGSGPGVINENLSIAELFAQSIPGSEGGLFTIGNINGAFNTISFKDASGLNDDGIGIAFPGQQLRTSTDGFDIAELSVTSVPEPGSLALIGAGLAGLGLLGRRRKAA